MTDGASLDAHSALVPTQVGHGSFRRSLRVGSRVLVCVLIWWIHAVIPDMVGDTTLEPSWTVGLAHAFLQRWQAGVDYVFTFGPLGYFSTNAYVSELFWTKLVVWEGVFGLLVAAVVTCVAFRVRGAWNRALFIVLLLLPTYPDAYTFVAIAAIAVWVLGDETGRLRVPLAGLAILAVFPLVKFSFVIPVGACAFVIVLGRGRDVSWRSGAALALVFVAMMVAGWVMLGQSLLNLPVYLDRSMQLASGYSEAMSSEPVPWTMGTAFALAGLLVLLAALFACASPRSFSRLAWACASVPVLFVVYKAGFVRGLDHPPIFFGFTLAAPFLLVADHALSHPWKAIAIVSRLACVGLSLFGLGTASGRGTSELPSLLSDATQIAWRNARAFLDPSALRAGYEVDLARWREQYVLPRTREAVGSATIDMISYRQGLLFLNGLNWRPRPVFQGYATFTPELMELNADFFRGERASEFILFAVEPIDGRLITLDDALALQVILRDYEPVLFEMSCLLLRRAPSPVPAEAPRVVLDRELAFGETLDLSGLEGSCHLLRLDIRYTPWGRIRTFLDQSPPLHMEIEVDTGETLSPRIIPGMMRAEVILNPLIRHQAEWKDWFVGAKLQRALALRVPIPNSPSLYEGSMHVTVLRADGVAPPARPGLNHHLEISLFETPPLEARSARRLRRAFIGSKEGLVLAAPSEMRYEVAPGDHVLRIGFGFERRAWVARGTDGANFKVLVRRSGEPDHLVFQRFLDPVRIPKDRGPQTAELSLDVNAPASVILAIDSGPRGDGKEDWTAWTEVSLK